MFETCQYAWGYLGWTVQCAAHVAQPVYQAVPQLWYQVVPHVTPAVQFLGWY